MELEQRHIAALEKAESSLFHRDFCPYLDLKSLLPKGDDTSRQRFRDLYIDHYQLRIGGLTPEFFDTYFEILFAPPRVAGKLDIRTIFERLCCIRNRRSLLMLPFSFVSKLVATHDETSPIYDRHVASFFRSKPPSSSTEVQARIDWCINFLDTVSENYTNWSVQHEVANVLDRLRSRDSGLAGCHDVRLLDILVWQAGRKKLL